MESRSEFLRFAFATAASTRCTRLRIPTSSPTSQAYPPLPSSVTKRLHVRSFIWRFFAMRLLILGATGGTGRALVDQAVARGHEVTAFVRSPQKLNKPRKGLIVRAGDPLNLGQLRNALAGQDAVLSAF